MHPVILGNANYPGKRVLAVDVPQAEANALMAVYYATGGDSWTNNTGWGTDTTVDNWQGVTVSGGHVTALDLNTNNLSDPTSISFTGLDNLVTIDLSDNSLTEASCNLILQALDTAGVFTGTLDLSGNTAPDYGTDPTLSATGQAVVNLLERDWTLTLTGAVPQWVLDNVELTVTSGTLHISIKDGEAMFFHDSEDFSPLAAEGDGTSNWQLEFIDATGLTARAFAASVGGGLALGAEIINNGTFDTDLTGWSTYAGAGTYSVVSGKARIVNDDVLDTPYIRQDFVVLPRYSIYLLNVSVTIGTAAQARVYMRRWNDGDTWDIYPTTDTEISVTLSGPSEQQWIGLFLFENGNTGHYCEFDNVSLKQVTDVPATGLRLVSTKDGSTRNLASKETGFNPSTVVKVRFLDPDA